MRRLLPLASFAALAVATTACGGGTPAMMDPAPPTSGFQIKSAPYTLQPGEEKYFCYTVTLAEPSQVALTKFEVFPGKLVHHIVAFHVNPTAPEPNGFQECPVLIKTSWLPLYAEGRNPQGFTLPTGAGFKLPGNAQVLMQLHLLNASTSPVTEKTILNAEYAPDASAVTPAGIYAVGTQNINLPPGTSTVSSPAGCTASKDMQVFAAFPHMHKYGTKIDLLQGATPSTMTEIYKRDPWEFGNQPMDPFNFSIKKGDALLANCTYDNTTAGNIVFGESSNNEMCYMVLFYTPFDSLDGCVQ